LGQGLQLDHAARDDDDDVAWRRGALVFRDAPFAEVADRVRRWYGVELRAADASIAARHVTADLTGEKIERVLQLLSLSLGADVERQGTLAVLRDASPDRGGGGRR
jgi:transmembrane sensor